MIATVVETGQLFKVVIYSLVAGVGISAVFGLGVSSAAGLIEAMREGRTGAAVAWGAVATTCALATIATVVIGIVVMASK